MSRFLCLQLAIVPVLLGPILADEMVNPRVRIISELHET